MEPLRRLSTSLPATPLRCSTTQWSCVPTQDAHPASSPSSPVSRKSVSRSHASSPRDRGGGGGGGAFAWIEKAVALRPPDEYSVALLSPVPQDKDGEDGQSDDGDDDGEDSVGGDEDDDGDSLATDEEPLADDADASERLQRLMMLLSLEQASVDEVLDSAARCYSARVLEHAQHGGDSAALSALPRAALEQLADFLQRPAVASQLASEPLDDERAALIELIESVRRAPPPAPEPPPQVLVKLDEESAEEGTADEDAADDDDDDDDGGGGGGGGGGPRGSADVAPAADGEGADGGDDDDGEDDASGLGRPEWSRPARARRAVQAALPSPPLLLPPHEMGWPSEADDDDDVAQLRAAGAAQPSDARATGIGPARATPSPLGGVGAGSADGLATADASSASGRPADELADGPAQGPLGAQGQGHHPPGCREGEPMHAGEPAVCFGSMAHQPAEPPAQSVQPPTAGAPAASASVSTSVASALAAPSLASVGPLGIPLEASEDEDEEAGGFQTSVDADFRMEGRGAAAGGPGASDEDEDDDADDADLPPWLRGCA